MSPPRSTFLVGAFLVAGCSSFSAGTRQCHSLMESAQEIVKNVDSKDRASVESSVHAVNAAWDACDKAGRNTERDELTQARNQLQAHLDYMTRKATEPVVPKQTAAELAALVKSGDPSCPKGQAYRRSPKEEVKCTGPQIVEMSAAKAQAYFSTRGYKITQTDSPPTLKVEYGAELTVFTYAAKDDSPPKCLTYYPPPGMSWQEATGRLTGTPLKRLESGKPVKTDHGDVTLRVDQSETKLIVYLGDCGG